MSNGAIGTQTQTNRNGHLAASRTQQTGAGEKFLTFFLAGEEYGLEILKVQEIIGMMDITVVPRTPAFVKGVINLRGKVIPVVDLRLKFDMEVTEQTEQTCIIVVDVGNVEMGIIVDKVSEVTNIAAEDIEDAPSFGVDVDTDYILGIGKSEGRVKLLLDIDRVLSSQEVLDIHSATASDEYPVFQSNQVKMSKNVNQ
jgi:purine-binding chemotaxis protein CheW